MNTTTTTRPAATKTAANPLPDAVPVALIGDREGLASLVIVTKRGALRELTNGHLASGSYDSMLAQAPLMLKLGRWSHFFDLTTVTPCNTDDSIGCAVQVPSTDPATMLTTWVCKRCGK